MTVNILMVLKALSTLKMLKDVVPAVREARQWYEALRARPRDAGRTTSSAKSGGAELADALEKLRTRVEQLEADGIKHADLTATQVEVLSQGLQLVARRMTALLITSAVAIVAAVAALIVVALR